MGCAASRQNIVVNPSIPENKVAENPSCLEPAKTPLQAIDAEGSNKEGEALAANVQAPENLESRRSSPAPAEEAPAGPATSVDAAAAATEQTATEQRTVEPTSAQPEPGPAEPSAPVQESPSGAEPATSSEPAVLEAQTTTAADPAEAATAAAKAEAERLVDMVAAVEERVPLEDRAVSVQALLHLAGKAFPEGIKFSKPPSLADLPDVASPVCGNDGRPLSSYTVWEVVKHFVHPATMRAQCSFAAALKACEEGLLDAPVERTLVEKLHAGDQANIDRNVLGKFNLTIPSFGRVSWFLSHAWSRPFLELVDAVWRHFLTQREVIYSPGHWKGELMVMATPTDGEIFYWIDIFAVSQHIDPTAFGKHNDSEFERVIAAAKYGTVLTMSPWDNPVTVTRVWCLFEIMKTIKQSKKLDVFPDRDFWSSDHAISPDQIDKLLALCADNLDASRGQATVPIDRERILAEIVSSYGIESFNAQIKGPMRARLLEALLLRSLEKADLAALRCLADAGAVLTVEQLELNWRHIGPECCAVLGEVLARSPAVQNVWMSGNNVGDVGAAAIAAAITANPTIRRVDCGNNGVGDEGARALAAAIKASSTMFEICLDNAVLGDEGATVLADAIEANGSLGVFWMGSAPNVTPAGADAIRAAWTKTRGDKGALGLPKFS